MDESILVSTLGKKYNIDVSSPEKIMALFNVLCNAVEMGKVLEANEKRIVSIHRDLMEEKRVLSLNKGLVFELVLGEKLSEIFKKKNKTIAEELGFYITQEKGNTEMKAPHRAAIPDFNHVVN